MEEVKGVIDGSPPSEGVIDGSPPSEGVSSESPPEGEAPAQESGAEVLPFGKHPRWIKMNEANKALKAQLQEAMDKLKEAEGAAATARWLKEDPKGFLAYLKSQIGEDNPEEENDQYAAFEPEVAERFRRYDKALEEVERQKKMMEERSKQLEEQKIAENRAELDMEFDKLAMDAGFVDEKGKADDEFMEFFAGSVLARLHAIAKDPRMPTKAELKTAFNSCVNGLKKGGKVFKPSTITPPPSGSNIGKVPSGKTKMTEEDRINDILRQLG